MRVALAFFTPDGAELAGRVASLLEPENELKLGQFWGGAVVSLFDKNRERLKTWFSREFSLAEAVIVIGATGIAVRMLDGLMRGKDNDPAVLVLDARGQFVIPLLSGHLGGANRLAKELALALGAQAIITTATDIQGVFAVDEWAVANDCAVIETGNIKIISAALLRGETVGFCSDFPVVGDIPPGLAQISQDTGNFGAGVCLSLDTCGNPFAQTLHIVPRVAILGAGCRKNTSPERFESFVLETLASRSVSVKALKVLASIDIKSEEPCMLAFAAKYGLDFRVFSATALQGIPGTFAFSPFVQAQTGVGNVCERAAMAALAGEAGQLVLPKTTGQGISLALAIGGWQGKFKP